MARRRNGMSNDHSRAPEVLDALERRKIELDPLIDAWQQQPGENGRDYGLFCMYRDHGKTRSIPQIAGMSPLQFSTIARISRLKRWVERVGQWDAEQDRIAAIRLHDLREEMARQHVKAAHSLMEKALERLKTLKIESISPHALVLMIDTAARIERAALGLENMKGAPQTTVTVAATTAADGAGTSQTRVEVGVLHERIMGSLDAMLERMSPEQIAAGYTELTASAEEATRELDAALPAPPPQ